MYHHTINYVQTKLIKVLVLKICLMLSLRKNSVSVLREYGRKKKNAFYKSVEKGMKFLTLYNLEIGIGKVTLGKVKLLMLMLSNLIELLFA